MAKATTNLFVIVDITIKVFGENYNVVEAERTVRNVKMALDTFNELIAVKDHTKCSWFMQDRESYLCNATKEQRSAVLGFLDQCYHTDKYQLTLNLRGLYEEKYFFLDV